MKKILKEYRFILLTILVMLFLRLFIFSVFSIDGDSMDYTFAHGDRIIGIQNSKIDRFDIVTFDVPKKKKIYIKRVIGLPGDTLQYKNDTLFINGEKVDEPYLYKKQAETIGNFTEDFLISEIPEGHYFVLGDNRNNSIDSRQLGVISEELITSEVKFTIWPLTHFKFFP